MPEPETIYRFAYFEFGTVKQELRKRGHRVRISASQLRLLRLFLERHGELVTREQIEARLWTDTATIDVTNGVNTAINRLRSHLGDDSAAPRYVETVIGLGYRFIAPVDVVVTGDPSDAAELEAAAVTDEAAQVQEASSVPETEQRLNIVWAVLVVVLMGAIGWSAVARFRQKPPAAVAEKPAEFARVTSNHGGNLVLAAAISPDGKLLAYADKGGARVQTLATHLEYALPTLPTFAVTRIAWFPSGDRLLISGVDLSTKRPMVRMVPLSGLYTPVMASDADLATISADGKTVAFTRAGHTELWVAAQNGENLRKVIGLEKRLISFVAWSPDGQRLLLSSHSGDAQKDVELTTLGSAPVIPDSPDAMNSERGTQWAWDSVSVATGKVLNHEADFHVESAVLLPDGRLKYLTGALYDDSLTAGKIMSVQTDPATGRFLGAPVAESNPTQSGIGGISASRDGSKIAVVNYAWSADVATASVHSGGAGLTLDSVEVLTSNLMDTYPHAWTPDGSVVYETGSNGRVVVMEQANAQAAPVDLGADLVDEVLPQLSPDGRWVMTLGLDRPSRAPLGIYRIPLSGGTPVRVPGSEGVDEFRCSKAACVMRVVKDKDARLYYALDPVSGVGKLLARTPWVSARRGDWGLSPDGTTVAVANHDSVNPGLNLLRLDGASNATRTLEVHGHGTPLGAHWAEDGKGLFVETRAGSGFELLYMDLDGHVQLLRTSLSAIWAIPSPDGKRIAFPVYTLNSNVWVGGVSR